MVIPEAEPSAKNFKLHSMSYSIHFPDFDSETGIRVRMLMLRMTFSILLETGNHCFYKYKTRKSSICPVSIHIIFLYWDIAFSAEWSTVFSSEISARCTRSGSSKFWMPHMRREAGGQETVTSQA